MSDQRIKSYPGRAIYAKFAAAIKERGVVQVAIAKRLGHNPNRVTKWAKGQSLFDAYQLRTICEMLDVPIRWMLDDDLPVRPIPRAGGDVFSTGLTPSQLFILEAAGMVGIEEAKRRIVGPASTDHAA